MSNRTARSFGSSVGPMTVALIRHGVLAGETEGRRYQLIAQLAIVVDLTVVVIRSPSRWPWLAAGGQIDIEDGDGND